MDTALRQAVREHRRVTIIYLDGSGRLTQRAITPRVLSGDHLIAFCHTRNTIRHFKVGNILGAGTERPGW